jgi:predicted RNase H-like nuclease
MNNSSWNYVGIDWDSGSWLAVAYSEENEVAVDVFDSIEGLWEEHGTEIDRAVVDVPIGLCSKETQSPGVISEGKKKSRKCDRRARSLIGPRSSSVFPAPSQEAAEAAVNEGKEYSEVSERNREVVGKGLTRQAASIADGIVEVRSFLDSEEEPTPFLEGHPELCFRVFADDDLQFNKKGAPGVVERLQALETCPEYESGNWRSLAESLRESEQDAGLDDLLDALALALTARASEYELQRLPDYDTTDDEFPMQMVYRRGTPFEY